jgi:hypothetical protein
VTQQDDTRTRSDGPLASLRGYAGLTALVLGGVYGYGALKKATELRGAHQTVRDTLPLVPLEQLLVTGITAALGIAAVLIFGLLLALVIAEWQVRREETPTERPEGDGDGFWSRASSYAPVVLGLSILIVLLIGTVAAYLLVAQVTLITWFSSTAHLRRRMYLAGVVTVGVATLLVLNYLDPDPLPKASITTERGDHVGGSLIAATGDTWYVAIADQHFVAVRADEVRKATVESLKDEDEESVFEQVTGSKFLGLPLD